jgi:DNA-binding beta-propeller fold protein YncE
MMMNMRSGKAAACAAVAVSLMAALCGIAASTASASTASASPGLTAPACTDQTASAPLLAGITPSTVTVSGSPFGVAILPGGQYAVAAVGNLASPSELAVLALNGGTPELVRTVTLPTTGLAPAEVDAAGLAISHDGQYLAVTQDLMTTILSVPALLAGTGDPVLGELRDGGGGTIEAAFSADDRYLFVSDEYASALSVFDLAKALRAGFSAAGVAVGRLILGNDVVGSVLSPDGKYLYVTSEVASPDDTANGLLQVVDVEKAETDTAASLVASADAGCQPVRVTLSADGSVAWVTARGSDALLAFDTAALRTRPDSALRADVQVGPQPVGVVLADDGKYALVANSARFTAPDSPQTVSVVDTGAALAGRSALAGSIEAGDFPRELGYDPFSREVILSNFGSGTVEVFRFPAGGIGIP